MLAVPPTRPPTSLVPPSATTPSFAIGAANRSYKHQYANIYFVRLRKLRAAVEENAKRRWKNVDGMPWLLVGQLLPLTID